MGIQINGNNDTISALDGSWTAEGATTFTGAIQTTSFKLTTNANNSYVLTSDANGVGTWQAASSSSSSDSITEGNTTVETVDTGSDGHIKFSTEGTERMRIVAGGSVGIGVNSPEADFHVKQTGTDDLTNSTNSYKGIYLSFEDGWDAGSLGPGISFGQRWYHGNSRDESISKINLLISEAFKFYESKPEIISYLEKSLIGYMHRLNPYKELYLKL